jgi:predicted acyltransferase
MSLVNRIKPTPLGIPTPAPDTPESVSLPIPPEKPQRLVSLDAYRGFIMLAMASSGLGLATVARRSFPDDPVWQFLGYQTDHAPWIGCSFWDLIQPSFMFMVGVAMPYSFASRRAKGHSPLRNAAHVVYRALMLCFLGVFLMSINKPAINGNLVNVLTQIGLGYGFVYLLLGRGWRWQFGAAAAILVGYWLLFALWPLPPDGFDYASVGANLNDKTGAFEDKGQVLTGFFAHWSMGTNAAAWFDQWLLGLFPWSDSIPFNKGGYATLNFVPSMATAIFGLMAGEWLRGNRSRWRTLGGLVVAGLVLLAAGWLLGETVCPLVKRIWTPSWAVFSTGWTLLILAAFYWVIDVQGWKAWSLPLIVVGMNSIAMYCMSMTMRGWLSGVFKTFLGQDVFAGGGVFRELLGRDLYPAAYAPIAETATLLLMFWLVCVWLYRRKVFIRI